MQTEPYNAALRDSAMLCAYCNESTRTVETRMQPGQRSIRRRRACGNGHRFTTYETLSSTWGSVKGRNDAAVATAAKRAALHDRNTAILARLAAGEMGKVIALDLGLSASSVSLIARGKSKRT